MRRPGENRDHSRNGGDGMIEKVDLKKKLGKAAYKEAMAKLELKAACLQREARSRGVPVVVLFEGWDAAGKGTLINRLMLALDARGCKVYPTNPPTDEERLRPFLWRFWINTPAAGRIAIFDRSWYGRVLVERVDRIVPKSDWSRAYDEINAFERQLTDGGAVICKFFLHISKKEQKRRFKKLQSNSSTAWKVTADDKRRHRRYDRYVAAIEDMLAETDGGNVPWTIVEAHDRRFATVKVFDTLVAAIEGRLEDVVAATRPRSRGRKRRRAADNLSDSILDRVDLNVSLSRSAYRKELRRYQGRIRELEHELYRRRLPVLVVYEGWDAGGKGGNIKRLVAGMDPRGYEVIPVAAPNDIEKQHHYLWRFWRDLPKAGHITIFDRSWYGRVLVERVEGFCTRDEWRRAYREINETEEQWRRWGAVLIKLWLQVDADEQLRRFEERRKTPHKQWKITDEDWRNREKWDAYKEAVDEMLLRTSTLYAPWTIVEANDKLWARIKALRTVVEAIEQRL